MLRFSLSLFFSFFVLFFPSLSSSYNRDKANPLDRTNYGERSVSTLTVLLPLLVSPDVNALCRPGGQDKGIV